MTINGNSSLDFHKYCDNKGPTLTLVKTTKNKIFGGFTPLNWENEGGKKFDKSGQTFLFSLNLMKKFDIINKEKLSISCRAEYGPIFGASDFHINSNMKTGQTFANKYSNFLPENNLELIGEKGDNNSFDIEDFEVYKVIY